MTILAFPWIGVRPILRSLRAGPIIMVYPRRLICFPSWNLEQDYYDGPLEQSQYVVAFRHHRVVGKLTVPTDNVANGQLQLLYVFPPFA
jgi:hypothetical protein